MNHPHESAAPALRRLLDLLASGAATEDFADVLADARRRGAPAAVLAEIDDATWQALRVHRTLRQHRRREAELTALFDTAGDLAASRELDTVLQAIVRRARMLLGTDTAYLTLPDEAAGDTYMRVTDGSVSVLFQTLRLSLGHGLGGLVAQTARPYATPDYRTDERFHHTGTIDAGVLDEGLVAIIGVPLLLGGEVIGVLFAADRSPRAFSPDEVALLCTLAAHAAIALDTAKSLADTRAALAELNSANELVRAHSAAVQRAEQAHDRLTDLVLRGAEVPDVAAAVAALLGGEIAVLDAEGEPLAGRSAPAGELAEAVAASRAEGRSVRHGELWVCAVLAGHDALGTLVLRGRPGLDDADRRLFERASVVTALLLLLRRSVAETENRVRGELLTDLLTAPDRDPAGLTARGRRLGVDLARPHLVLVAEPAEPAGPPSPTAADWPAPPAGTCSAPGASAPSTARRSCCWSRRPATRRRPRGRPPSGWPGWPGSRSPWAPAARPPARPRWPPRTPRGCAASGRCGCSAAPGRAPRPARWASSGCCSATGTTWTASSARRSARCSPTTPGAAPNWSAPCAPTSTAAAASPAPRTNCTST